MLALALVLAMAPEPGEERLVVEAAIATEVLYPPAQKIPKSHIGYSVAASGVVHGASSFKAVLGFGVDHVVGGWLGDPTGVRLPREGTWRGTQPRSYRGHLLRAMPVVRLGIENDFAFGYLGGAPGYALRIARLSCLDAPCQRSQAVDHGLNLGLNLGAMISPSQRVGVVIGAEVGLDWSWFPKSHPGLAAWNQAMSARAIVGWRF